MCVKEDELTGLDQQALDDRTTSVVKFVTDLKRAGVQSPFYRSIHH
jgi:hypothetical protein